MFGGFTGASPCKGKAALGSAHQLECVGKKFRPAEIARFQCKQHRAVLGADRAQNRHSCSDFCPDKEAGNPKAIDQSWPIVEPTLKHAAETLER